MIKRDAEILLNEFFSGFGKSVKVFAERDFVKVNIGEAIIGFEFRATEKTLFCHALIYQFRQPPRPEILSAIEHEEQNGADTGGGEIVFDQKNNSLALVRGYDKFVDPDVFTSQIQKLAAASLTWSSTVLDRAATSAFGE